jgi:hypothetical protein
MIKEIAMTGTAFLMATAAVAGSNCEATAENAALSEIVQSNDYQAGKTTATVSVNGDNSQGDLYEVDFQISDNQSGKTVGQGACFVALKSDCSAVDPTVADGRADCAFQ